MYTHMQREGQRWLCVHGECANACLMWVAVLAVSPEEEVVLSSFRVRLFFGRQLAGRRYSSTTFVVHRT